ncbi:MAG TPA: fibronectin type III domain-containing protein [Candidatus Ozemobacteraceae bacterium]|nr:fibronectin type III domain-containing protein [Candidatus Ozemobacteraceae bacterium]
MLKRCLAGFAAVLWGLATGVFALPPRDHLSAPVVSSITPVSFKVGWATYPVADETTHYQPRIENALYGTSVTGAETTVIGLRSGRTMDVRILTYHRGALIGISSPTSVLTGPAAPSALSASDIATNAFSLRWQPVDTATSYRIYRLPDTLLATVPAPTTQVRIGGFQPGEEVRIGMTAVNPSSASFLSASITVRLLPAPPAMSVSTSDIGQTSFVVGWSPVSGAATYTVLTDGAVSGSVASSTLKFTVTGLSAGSTVAVQVRAENESGSSELSSPPVRVLLLPPTPAAPVAGGIGPKTVKISWAPVAGVDGYKVWRDHDWLVANVPSTVTSVQLVSGINPGDVATYTVSAWNATGDSPRSVGTVVSFPLPQTTRHTGISRGRSEIIEKNIISGGLSLPLAMLANATGIAAGGGGPIGATLVIGLSEAAANIAGERVRRLRSRFDTLCDR